MVTLAAGTADNAIAGTDVLGNYNTSGGITRDQKIRSAGQGRIPFSIRIWVPPANFVYLFHMNDSNMKLNELNIEFDNGAGTDCLAIMQIDGTLILDTIQNIKIKNLNIPIAKGAKLEFFVTNTNGTQDYNRIVTFSGVVLCEA